MFIYCCRHPSLLKFSISCTEGTNQNCTKYLHLINLILTTSFNIMLIMLRSNLKTSTLQCWRFFCESIQFKVHLSPTCTTRFPRSFGDIGRGQLPPPTTTPPPSPQSPEDIKKRSSCRVQSGNPLTSRFIL